MFQLKGFYTEMCGPDVLPLITIDFTLVNDRRIKLVQDFLETRSVNSILLSSANNSVWSRPLR